ncbi:hypothetical protein AB4Z25_24945 [Rhizobium sp. RAF36]|uniref:hypothetical protein n=1 Tax=Rhizobium sp. RAF36 TaxID=3233055 RepID=UPI003F9B6170
MTETLGPSSPPELLMKGIEFQERSVAKLLSTYERKSAISEWLATIRSIEETVNLMTVDWDEEFKAELFSLRILQLTSSSEPLRRVRRGLAKRFDDEFADRFASLMMQLSALGVSFRQKGFPQLASAFSTLSTAVGYLQSRRRACVALLHCMPNACIGSTVVSSLDPVLVFFPVIEIHAIQLTTCHNALLVGAAMKKLGIDDFGMSEFASLDDQFLEPERSRITEMELDEKGHAIFARAEKLRADRLFSAAELRNDLLLLEAAYAEFDLSMTNFGRAAALIRNISRNFVDRDFSIKMRVREMETLFKRMDISPDLQNALVFRGTSYAESIQTYAPFVRVDDTLSSSITLLSRFAYHWRARSLDRIKRFQIRSGFIFEKAVAACLERQGYEIRDIKRIDRHEFDVIAAGDGVLWNIQCKNNFLDLAYLEASPARFARFNHRLVRSYERALMKDRRREHVLSGQTEAGGQIEHVVIARFPVICDNPRILPFSRISEFRSRTKDLRTQS